MPSATSASPRFTGTAYQTEEAPNETLLWIDDRLPAELRAGLRLDGATLTTDRGQANLLLTIDSVQGWQELASLDWVYVLAARFPTVRDSISSGQVRQIWQGGDGAHSLLMDTDTHAVFASLWGLPVGSAVKVMPAGELLQAAWQDGDAWALLPFGAIEPRWKVLRIDGFDIFERTLDVSRYPLGVKARLLANGGQAGLSLPESNRQPNKLLSLMMTGTTALVRKTAQLMNERGITYPAKDVGGVLRAADLTHISNEVSFNQECRAERAASGEGIFCSAPGYIKLLEEAGTDIVELTGNHNLDKGEAGYLYTLKLFEARSWQIYGGGLDLASAQAPLLIDRGNTKLAFVGCNMAGPDIAWATSNAPGAATCDFDQIEKTVRQLRQAGFLPVVTFQAFETEDYMPMPMQRPSEFTRMAEAGAVIVSGSQAHFPQGFALRPGSLVHFGLGNLFFDQIEPEPIRRAFIDRHIFYGGVYLGAELITILQEERGKPRLMSAEERTLFLSDVFEANGWKAGQPLDLPR